MVSYIGNMADRALTGLIDGGKYTLQKLRGLGERVSWMGYDLYSLEGFEKFTKAMVANLRAIQLIFGTHAFKKSIEIFEVQKDLIYGTLVLNSIPDFIKVTRDEDGNITGYTFQLPKVQKRDKYGDMVDTNEIDYVKLLYGIGNFFETGKFLQKYNIMSFPLCSQIAGGIGSIKVFNYCEVKDVPVFNCWTKNPKDFFVFFASAYTTYQCLTKEKEKFWDVANLVKLAGATGKMVLISRADWMLKNKYIVVLTVIDVVTQNASLIGIWIKRERGRQERLDKPAAPRL